VDAGSTGPEPDADARVDSGGRSEVSLRGGDVTEGVVRVGDTVRRPRGPWSSSVAAYLRHLEEAGFEGAPRFLGVDEQGRDVLDFVPGDVPGSTGGRRWAATADALVGVAGLLRTLHAASASFVPLIDFDLTRPGTRLRDVVNTATWWVPLSPPGDRDPAFAAGDVPARLAAFVDAYRLDRDERSAFHGVAVDGAARSWHRMKANAEIRGGGWARMWDEGIGDRILRRRAWLVEERTALDAALGAQ
jgi:hypothetical protein